MDFVKHIHEMIKLGQNLIMSHPELTEETEQINTKGDHTMAMDARIEQELISYVRDNHLPVTIFSEEVGVVAIHPSPKFILAFDPLDGSTNFRLGNNMMPYGFLLAVYKGTHPRIHNVIAAGAYEITQNLGFLYDGHKTYDLNQHPVNLKPNWNLGQSTPVYLDLYRKNYYDSYLNLPGKVYIRNTGSTIGNLMHVLQNTAAAMGHPQIKAEEIGAVYGLITGADGSIIDHEGNDLGEEQFLFDKKYHLLAGSKKVVHEMASHLILMSN